MQIRLATSELLLDGKPTGLIVTGAVLEAALEWQGCRIAFLIDDIPFEDMLRIYMFDANMTLADAAVLGAMYSTGTFAELSLQPPGAVTFRFWWQRLAHDTASRTGICHSHPFRSKWCKPKVQILQALQDRRQAAA